MTRSKAFSAPMFWRTYVSAAFVRSASSRIDACTSKIAASSSPA